MRFRMRTSCKVLRWLSVGFGAVALALAKEGYAIEVRAFDPFPIAEAEQVLPSRGSAIAPGKLEGTVTLGCASGATDCVERPYQVGLWLYDARSEREPKAIDVSKSGAFSTSVPPGTYTISSGDVGGACCLPLLQPVNVIIRPGETVHVTVRFQPGLRLPTR